MSDNDDNLPSLHEKIVAVLLHLQASFVLTPDFGWRQAVEQIEFEATRIRTLFDSEQLNQIALAELVKQQLKGTEFESHGLLAGINAMYQDWVNTNLQFSQVVGQRDGMSTELIEARTTIARLKQERDEWKRAAEAESQGRQLDNRLLNELLDQMEPGAYRDPLEERLANPLRQRLGKPREFAMVPGPDCTKVIANDGATYRYMPGTHSWMCTFAPGVSGAAISNDVKHEKFIREFRPFVEVLDDKQRADS